MEQWWAFWEKTYDWLAASDTPQEADVIFVLAGRNCRKHYGLRMFDQGLAGTLLLSVGRFEIRRFSEFKLPLPTDLVTLAATTKPDRRHYFVALREGLTNVEQVPLCRFGTWSEVRAFSLWLRERESIATVIIVSSGYHLRRVRWCCRALLLSRTKVRFVAVPHEDPSLTRERWWRDTRSRKLVLQELGKILLYRCFGRRSTGISGSSDAP